MTINDIQHIMEEWAPKEIAWEHDNIGLQVGASRKKINRILVTLSITDGVIVEAKRLNADLIITHHPLIFKPVASICDGERTGRLINSLIRHNIAVYCAHTNLDFTRDGVSFALARKLGIRSIEFLHQGSTLTRKIVVFVPETHAGRVREAMTSAGAGTIGNYESCSFSTPGTGSFRPVGTAKPFTGKLGRLESVEEVRLEMNVPAWRVGAVTAAMRLAHPYEEIAYDVYPTQNVTKECGKGTIGDLPRPMKTDLFLKHIRQSLKVRVLRTNQRRSGKIGRVACCGGGGSELLQSAIRNGADAFVTGDVTFHRFEEADGRILLIDAGHYETEHPVLGAIVDRLKEEIGRRPSKATVIQSKLSGNYINYRI